MSLPSLLVDLMTLFGDKFRRNESLGGHTTLRLGGPADVWLPVDNVTELTQAVTLAHQHEVLAFMLGSGANLLIGDGGIRGLVIENRSGRVDFEGEGNIVTADSGVSLISLTRRCAKQGLSGLEWAVGIPGTVGGAVINNAGAFGSDMAHCLTRAELLSPTGERVWQPVEWFEYRYRASRLKKSVGTGLVSAQNWVVLRAEMRLTPGPSADIETRMQEFNARRKASQPPGATIGSMFKNPPGDYAGRLIEAAGLKGIQCGQAQISPVHANFFVNLGGATAADMLKLIDTARQAVKDKFNIELNLEIEVVGEF